MPDTTKSEASDAKKVQEEAKPAEPVGSAAPQPGGSAANGGAVSATPMPNPDSSPKREAFAAETRLHETLPEGLPKPSNEPGGPTPGTLPGDPTQATDPGAAKPGTPGVD